jgi:hydrogenase maturation protease
MTRAADPLAVDPFEGVAAVADAVLYEGYLLYPYRASSDKNRMRFQFGVLVPPDAVEATADASDNRTECLCEPAEGATLWLRLRYLHLRARRVEVPAGDGGFRPVDRLVVGDIEHTTWDEAVERQVDAVLPFHTLLPEAASGYDAAVPPVELPFDVPASVEVEALGDAGRLVRTCAALHGMIRVSAAPLSGPFGAVRLRVDIRNETPMRSPVRSRDDALPSALLGAHTMLAVSDGSFLSLVDPPEWAAAAIAECENVRTWPVLVGDPDRRSSMLSAPIILYDFPSIAPESLGPLFDGTEIDEILTLRTMTLTEEEKRQARATDERARAIVDRVDAMPPELLDRLHGTVRYLRQVTGESVAEPDTPVDPTAPPDTPWWDPAADASVDPDTDAVFVAGVAVRKGSRVRLAPRRSGTDAQDMFLQGKLATVAAVVSDVDGAQHIAVTVDDDPAAELANAVGRFRYFAPTELRPIDRPDADPAHRDPSTRRILVAGIGNIFFGDDGFGVEVAHRLAGVELPAGTKVVDYGIRGVHLAYDMLAGYDVTILVDAVSRGDEPGTVSIIDVGARGAVELASIPVGPVLDPHGMTPDAVLEHVRTLGGDPGHVFVVGCEPADCDERIGLSDAVTAAVDVAVTAVADLVAEQLSPLSEVHGEDPSEEPVKESTEIRA